MYSNDAAKAQSAENLPFVLLRRLIFDPQLAFSKATLMSKITSSEIIGTA